jgi:hypothetical protein
MHTDEELLIARDPYCVLHGLEAVWHPARGSGRRRKIRIFCSGDGGSHTM